MERSEIHKLMMLLIAFEKLKRKSPKDRWERIIEIMDEINEMGMKNSLKKLGSFAKLTTLTKRGPNF